MTFPTTALDLRTEINLGGTWTDISAKVYTRDAVQITRGRADEEAQASPAKAKLTINNRGGEFSPRNPRSPYFGILNRNTPIRLSLPAGSSYLRLPGGSGDYVSAPDTAALSVTGDTDVRVDAFLYSWRQAQDLASKYSTVSNQRSWALNMDGDGFLQFVWSVDGTATLNAFSTVPVLEPASGRQAIRVTIDVDNGAAGRTVTFYTSDTITGSWTQLGAAVIQAGTTSIFDATASLVVGDIPTSGNAPARGRLYGFELRSGIGGTVVADLDPTAGMFGQPYLVGTPVAQPSGSTTVTLTVTAPVPAGSDVDVVLGAAGANVVSLVDSRGNTYSLVTSDPTNPRTFHYRAPAIAAALQVGDTVTATMSATTNAYNMIVVACAGVLAVDVSNHATGTSTAPSVTTATLAAAYELVVAAITNGNGGGTPSWAAGWNVLATAHNGVTQWTSVAYRTTSTTSAVTASATIVSATWTATVATFRPVASPVGVAGPYIDAYGNVWTLGGATTVDDRAYRFHGEVTEWPPRWDVDEKDVWVPVEASGITRRLGQGASPLRSAMYRSHIRNAAHLRQYWPLEDAAESTSAVSGLPGMPAMTISGTPQLGSYDGWHASAPMVQLDSGRLIGSVPAYTATGDVLVYCFLYVAAAPPAETDLIIVTTTGTLAKFKVLLLANGNLRIRAYESDDTEITTAPLTAEIGFGLLSRAFGILQIHLQESGSDVNWDVNFWDFKNTDTVSDGFFAFGTNGTVTAHTAGAVKQVIVNDNGNIGDTKASHLVVSDSNTIFSSLVSNAIKAYNGENPSTRFARLCGEEGITSVALSRGTGNTVLMGYQLPKKLEDLLSECADADLGIRYEPREQLALGFRTRMSLYNQVPRLALDYSAGHVAPPLEPVDDDQNVRNDITVTREFGSSEHIERTTGTLSTAAPPNGVGRYDTSVTLSLSNDGQLADQAGWRLRLGTIDEARYPIITVDLASDAIAGNSAQAAAVRTVDIGDRITISNPPAWLPPDQISQIVQGYTETFGPYEHEIAFTCTPESAWQVAVTDDTDKRAAATAAQTSGAFVSGTDTSLTVVTTDGPPATTDPADLPFNITVSGVVLQVTAVTGSTSPQTFTVTQAPVNGITKTIPSGSAVQVTNPAYVGMV